ncbi:hypothetical protein Dimus_016297 [Dionaea muscipula]
MERIHCSLLFIITLVYCGQTSLAIHITGGVRHDQIKVDPIPNPAVDKNANANAKTTADATGVALIEKACQSTIYKDFCISTLRSKPEAQTIDVKGLAFLSMKLAKEHANVTAAFIASKLKNEESLGPELDDALEECNDQYDDALAQIEDSMQAFLSNAANDVKTWLSTAITNADTCEQSIKDSSVAGALGDRNQVFEKLCSTALAITNYFFQQQ